MNKLELNQKEYKEYLSFCNELNIDPSSNKGKDIYLQFEEISKRIMNILKEVDRPSANMSVNLSLKYAFIYIGSNKGEKVALHLKTIETEG